MTAKMTIEAGFLSGINEGKLRILAERCGVKVLTLIKSGGFISSEYFVRIEGDFIGIKLFRQTLERASN